MITRRYTALAKGISSRPRPRTDHRGSHRAARSGQPENPRRQARTPLSGRTVPAVARPGPAKNSAGENALAALLVKFRTPCRRGVADITDNQLTETATAAASGGQRLHHPGHATVHLIGDPGGRKSGPGARAAPW